MSYNTMNERDIVLFLGAGFSKDAGLPIMRKFGEASDKEYKSLLKHTYPETPSFRNAAPMLREAGLTFQHFQEFCKRASTLSCDDVNNFGGKGSHLGKRVAS